MKTLNDMQQPVGPGKMDTDPIRRLLGEDMPDITPTPLGRFRLISALKSKFGPSYRNYPQASEVLSHFDSEMSYFSKIREMGGK